MGIFDKNFRDIFSAQFISITGGLLAGTVLAVYTDRMFMLPGMLILLPGFLEMRGNISGTLSARMTSGLFLGVIKCNRFRTRIVRSNILASFFLAVFVSLMLGLLAASFNLLVLGVLNPEIIIVPLLAGLIANAVEIPLALFATFYLFRKGHDPDNIMGPFITTTGDITSVVSLLVALVLI
ncbi:MAG: magnesium transporter [Candidatus Aenigmatarchaeota archaeon]